VHWQKRAKLQLPSEWPGFGYDILKVAIQQPLKACDVHAAEYHMPAA